jgi:hypothetical protein
MSKLKKIFLIVGLVSVAIGGFALTKYLTRNTKRVRGGVIRKQIFEEPAQAVEFNEE